MKEGAEKVELKIQAKVESLKHANEGDKGMLTLLFGLAIAILFRFRFVYWSRDTELKRLYTFILFYYSIFIFIDWWSHNCI